MLQNFGPFVSLQRVLEEGGVLAVIGLFLVVTLSLIIVAARQRRLAIYILLASMALSLLGEPFHSVFDLVRWLMVFVLVPMGLPGIVRMGWLYWLLWINALLSAMFIVRSPNGLYSLQMFILLAATLIGYAGCLAQVVKTPSDLGRLFRVFGGLGLVVGLVSVGMFVMGRGTEDVRFSGVGVSPGQLSLVSAILMCFCVWLAIHGSGRLIRGFWTVVTGLLGISMVLSTQRTGILLAVVALTYYMARKINRQTLRRLGLMASLAAIVFIGLMLISPERRSYIFLRFSGGESGLGATSGRADIWRAGLTACMEKPLTGTGTGSDMIESWQLTGHSFHNAYLAVWYNSGLVGLILFMTAVLGTFWQARRLSKRLGGEEGGDAMRILAGLILGIMASGFFERALAGNASLLVAVVLLTMVSARALKYYTQQYSYAEDVEIYYDEASGSWKYLETLPGGTGSYSMDREL